MKTKGTIWEYIGESDEMTTKGKEYFMYKEKTFKDDNNETCHLGDDFNDYFKLKHPINLDALDIVDEKIWNGSELQYMLNNEWFDFDDNTRIRLKPSNPEVKQLQELADKLGYKIKKL